MSGECGDERGVEHQGGVVEDGGGVGAGGVDGWDTMSNEERWRYGDELNSA